MHKINVRASEYILPVSELLVLGLLQGERLEHFFYTPAHNYDTRSNCTHLYMVLLPLSPEPFFFSVLLSQPVT